MKNKIILSLLLVCALAMPVFAKAVSVDELKALIAQLQAQIQALQAQLAQQQGGTTAWCHTFNTNLGIGSSGAEVNALHSVLSKEVITGDFGWASDNFDENTASYVVGLQEKYANEILSSYGLSHGTGYVGKSTRAKLNKLYGCGNVEKPCPLIAKICPDGSYAVSTGSNCEQICPTETYPVTCISEGKTGSRLYADRQYCCSGLTEISNSWGSGTTCVAPTNGSFTCTYCGNGVCGTGENSCNCPSDCKKSENQPPVIDGVTAPTQLKVNEQGTWQIKAHDPENDTLGYLVNWGDGASVGGGGSLSAPTIFKEGAQTTTFSHSYSKAGTYTITFTISDDRSPSKSVKTSTTVRVVDSLSACVDSDGAKAYYSAGSVYDSGKNYADYCVDSYKLKEYFCLQSISLYPSSLGGVAEDMYACPNGCSNGACKN